MVVSLISQASNTPFESLYEYNQCRLYKDGKYDMLHGQDETILPSLAQGGAKGGIGGTTNYNGRELTGIIEAWNKGDLETAREKQNFSQEVSTSFVTSVVISLGVSVL